MSTTSVLAGLVLLVLGTFAAWRIRQMVVAGTLPATYMVVYRYRLLLALPLAVVGVVAHFQVGSGEHAYTSIGIPFEYAGLDARGRDFVSILTPFLLIANAYIGYRIPDILLWLVAREAPPGMAPN